MINQEEDIPKIPLRPIPKASWYSKLKSPYQSKRELKNYFKGSIILISFMVVIMGILYWLLSTFGK